MQPVDGGGYLRGIDGHHGNAGGTDGMSFLQSSLQGRGVEGGHADDRNLGALEG